MQFAVESWSPEYGAPMESGPQDAGASVDLQVEVPVVDWAPVTPSADAPPPHDVLFIDGVRRIDARVWLDAGSDSVLGICASYAAGSVRCNATAALEDLRVERALFTRAGAEPIVTRNATYPLRAVATDDLDDLIRGVQQRMGALEIAIAADAAPSDLVVVDGPLSGRQNVPQAIGMIKTHRVRYLPEAGNQVVAALASGQRTPLFLTQTNWSRFSWYVRLPGGNGHPWAGVVRCEASADRTLDEVRQVADMSARQLVRFASEAHKDPRAPQNLYPIAGLERQLRHRLGDPTLLYRSLCAAAGSSRAA